MYRASYKTKKNGVPILSKAGIEAIAEQVILDFDPQALQIPKEIDIDYFALSYLGLKQDFQFLSHNGVYLGMTVFNDTDKVPVYVPETNKAAYISAKARTIIIDNNLLVENQEPRYRYTMGHECGHAILHHGYFAYDPNQLTFDNVFDAMIQCRAIPSNGQSKPVTMWTDKDRMEWQANYLSAALLMPKRMVIKLIDSLPPDYEKYKTVNYIEAVVTTFKVSRQAAEIRLKDLGIL